MATIVKCDRCGMTMPSIAYTARLSCDYFPTPIETDVKVDLCVKCASDLKAFFKNEDVNRRYRIANKE